MRHNPLKIIILLLAIEGINKCAYGADPSCFPGEPASENADGHILRDSTGCAFTWWCDEGHKWVRYGFYGSTLQCQAFVASNKFASLASLSHAEKLALYQMLPLDDPSDAATKPLVDTTPVPTKAPASGLVTTDTKIYGVASSTDFNILSPVGTIGLNVKCDSIQSVTNSNGIFYVVPSNDPSIKWTGSKRLRVYASCQS